MKSERRDESARGLESEKEACMDKGMGEKRRAYCERGYWTSAAGRASERARLTDGRTEGFGGNEGR